MASWTDFFLSRLSRAFMVVTHAPLPSTVLGSWRHLVTAELELALGLGLLWLKSPRTEAMFLLHGKMPSLENPRILTPLIYYFTGIIMLRASFHKALNYVIDLQMAGESSGNICREAVRRGEKW